MKISELDIIAYKLYKTYANKNIINKNMDIIKIDLFSEYNFIFKDYYKDANIILRKNKINKINEKL